jgi:hypothetical protein
LASRQDPGVRALAVSANRNVGVESEPEQQVAKQHSMVFRISTSLIVAFITIIKALTLAKKACIECHTSTRSAPGASSLWKGINDTNRAACRGDSNSRSAIIGAMSEQTGLKTLASRSSVSAKILTNRFLWVLRIALKSDHQSFA